MADSANSRNSRRFLFLPAVLALAFVQTAVPQTSETFGGNIVLGRPTDRWVTVNVLFTADQDSVYLEYGARAGALD